MAIDTPQKIDAVQRLVVVKAMEMYILHGIKASRFATPANLRALATKYTGVEYPRSRRGLIRAYQELIAWHNERAEADLAENGGEAHWV